MSEVNMEIQQLLDSFKEIKTLFEEAETALNEYAAIEGTASYSAYRRIRKATSGLAGKLRTYRKDVVMSLKNKLQ